MFQKKLGNIYTLNRNIYIKDDDEEKTAVKSNTENRVS